MTDQEKLNVIADITRELINSMTDEEMLEYIFKTKEAALEEYRVVFEEQM